MLTLLLTSRIHSLLVVSDDMDKAFGQIEKGLRDIYQDDLCSFRYDIERRLLHVTWSGGPDLPVEEDLYRVSPLDPGDLLWLTHNGDSSVNKIPGDS
jgi:hypothetical protein